MTTATSDQPISLLLIEDSAELTRLIGNMLANARNPSFKVETAGNLADGAARVTAGGIDLVVLDLALPDSDGLESLYRLRAEAAGVPIVVVTGLEDEETALKALREGAQDYLLKGEMSWRALVRAIRYALERKRGEETRSRLAAIVESSRDAIIGMSLEGLIVSWNPGAERIFGHQFEDVIGRPIGMLVPPDCTNEMPSLLQALMRGEYLKDYETVRLKKDRERIHVAASVSPIKNSFGKIIGASMIARDIEERIHAEEEREALILQLQDTLAHVNRLKGLLPICASCKKIRDDHGYWTQVDIYVQDHSQAEFTHGICPDCAAAYRLKLPKKLEG